MNAIFHWSKTSPVFLIYHCGHSPENLNISRANFENRGPFEYSKAHPCPEHPTTKNVCTTTVRTLIRPGEFRRPASRAETSLVTLYRHVLGAIFLINLRFRFAQRTHFVRSPLGEQIGSSSSSKSSVKPLPLSAKCHISRRCEVRNRCDVPGRGKARELFVSV